MHADDPLELLLPVWLVYASMASALSAYIACGRPWPCLLLRCTHIKGPTLINVGRHASMLLGSIQPSSFLQVLGPATGPWTVNKTVRPVVVMAAKFQMEVSQDDPIAESLACCAHDRACAPLRCCEQRTRSEDNATH